MIQHWHVRVTTTPPHPPYRSDDVLADWLVESEGKPGDDDLLEAAAYLNIHASSPLVFPRWLAKHIGEFPPGGVRFENDSVKVWVIPPPAANESDPATK